MRKSLNRLTLRQMQVFLAVCDHRSYSRAAEAMALTQPAISLQMRQLEELVGQPLFEYVGRKLHLTEAAEALQRACLDVLGRLENLDMQLSDLRGSLQGQLRLAVETSAQYFVPHLFAAFRARHPEVSLQMAVVNHAQALKRLSVHRDDLLIMTMVPADMGLEFLPFLDNPIIAVARSDHPLAQRSGLQLQDLTARLEVRRAVDNTPVTSVPGEIDPAEDDVAGGATRRVSFSMPLATVPPGEYIAHAIVSSRGEVVAERTRQVDVLPGDAPPASADVPRTVIPPLEIERLRDQAGVSCGT